jgi:hypothetical protein
MYPLRAQSIQQFQSFRQIRHKFLAFFYYQVMSSKEEHPANCHACGLASAVCHFAGAGIGTGA